MNILKRLHEEEEGLEMLQVVLILAFAAIVLAFVKKIWEGPITAWITTKLGDIGIQIGK
jgi:hypothetical protein